MNGHYVNGKQRFYCLDCHKSFSWSNKSVKKNNEFIWFARWIIEGYSVRQLHLQSGFSESTIKRIINYWLTQVPPENNNYDHFDFLVFDGTFIYKRLINALGIIDSETGKLIKGGFDIKENSVPKLIAFFTALKNQGLMPKSCTTDGNPQVIACLRAVWPTILIQRCLVHIQRQGLMWCRANPKTVEARKLRELFVRVTAIKNTKEKESFLNELMQWEEYYGQKIARKPETGWVFSDLKKARSMLLKALPNMFHYLDNSHIPFSTNQIEGYFSRLKDKYHDHRGLSPQKRRAYFTWYFFLKP